MLILVFFITALIMFLLSAFNLPSTRVGLLPLGLFFLTLALALPTFRA